MHSDFHACWFYLVPRYNQVDVRIGVSMEMLASGGGAADDSVADAGCSWAIGRR